MVTNIELWALIMLGIVLISISLSSGRRRYEAPPTYDPYRAYEYERAQRGRAAATSLIIFIVVLIGLAIATTP